VSPSDVAALLQGLDAQADSLLKRAMAKRWTLEEFREERDYLGRLAANYVDAVRAAAGWPPLQLKSLWMWDKPEDKQGDSELVDESGRAPSSL
jgi:hypothetical protein